jgi:hypothetical protein
MRIGGALAGRWLHAHVSFIRETIFCLPAYLSEIIFAASLPQH